LVTLTKYTFQFMYLYQVLPPNELPGTRTLNPRLKRPLLCQLS